MANEEERDETECPSKRIRSTGESSQNTEASQVSSNSSVSAKDNIPKAGIILKVSMKNFMCHEYCEVKLGSQINIIVGRNGSGKSAVLTAVVLGLGGKASSTNRGSSFRDLVKKGSTVSTIEVTLHNAGVYSYKSDVYGDRIIVQRTLNAYNGQSNYKLKSGKGTLISTKKEELDRITLALNMQVDNPVSVLNQDAAKTFLNSTNPSDKYRFLMKATKLDYLVTSYNNSLEEKRQADMIIKAKEKSVLEGSEELKDLEKKLKTVQSLKNYQNRVSELENEFFWSEVVVEEKSQEKIQEKLSTCKMKLTEMMKNMEQESDGEKEMRKKLSEVEQNIQEKKSMISTFRSQLSGYKEEAQKRKENYSLKKTKLRSEEAKKQRISDAVTALEQAIESYNPVSSAEQAAKKNKIQQEIKQLEEEQTNVQGTLITKNQLRSQLLPNIEKTKNELQSNQQEISEIENKIGQQKRAISSLKNDSSNSLTVFGAWAPKVNQKIEEAYNKGLFEKKPQGPLGAYIKLKDASWAPAIEGFLGALLKAYCVTSSHDANVLTKIFKEVLRGEKMPNIISSPFVNKIYDVRRHAVQSNDYSSILNMLIISDPVVCNTLIDQREIETVLLIPNGIDAARILSDINTVPLHCRRAITKKGDQFYPDPNYRTYAGNGNTNAKYLQVSMQDALRRAEDDLKNALTQRESLFLQLKRNKGINAHYETEFDCIERDINQLRTKNASIQSRLTRLKDIEEPEPNNVASLMDDLKDAKASHDKAEAVVSIIKDELQKLLDNYKEIDLKIKDLQEKLRELENNESILMRQKQNLQSEVNEILSKKQYQGNQYNVVHKEISLLAAQLKKQCEIVNDKIHRASKMCSRIETERLPDDVEKELSACKSYMASVEQHAGSFESVGRSYSEKKSKHDIQIREVAKYKNRLKELESHLLCRKQKFKLIENYTTLRIQHMFSGVLITRGYSGKVIIDHDNKAVNIEVSPRGNPKQESGEKRKKDMDTNNLSGGERSFSTVALFIALWNTVETPFYFLDEFDVFMDKVNRRVILDLLMEHARQNTNFQYVFLTPQDMSHILAGSDVKILRMEDPRGGRSSMD